ncbi:FecR family protein [Sphingomonas sp. MMS24-J13]|uniref:FecR family protein n=1 Tax=Sphingomonas sp. MMS24-J13 TaxID=3238686 RepID=UPI00384F2C39
MSSSVETAMDEAIAWHIGLEQAGAEEWHRFVRWLEADPAHAEAYDQITLESAALSPARIELIEIEHEDPVVMPFRRPRNWLRWGGAGGGLVAAAAAAWLAFMPAAITPDSYTVETQPGMRHSVTLADGTRVDMNGGTRLVLDRNQPRTAMLERGEAIFHVVHHASNPFEVRSGGVTLRDVGTVFNVARSGSALRVAVSEGSVLYQPDHEAVSLTKGMALAMRDGEDRVTLSHVDEQSVGGWADGHLDFRDAALTTVVDDVSRSTGAHVSVAPEMGARLFTGTLRLDRPSDEVVRSLAALANAELYRDGPNWVIRPKSGGAH